VTFSPLARPPIQPVEAEGCDTAICPAHKGLIRETGDKEGTVFWCPIGQQHWRFTAERTSFTAPINYPKTGVI
jgi:hypothetical protein